MVKTEQELLNDSLAEMTAKVNLLKNKPRKTEITDNGKIVQTIEISDDNLIVVTKTNPQGL